jgi:hypothetical protein
MLLERYAKPEPPPGVRYFMAARRRLLAITSSHHFRLPGWFDNPFHILIPHSVYLRLLGLCCSLAERSCVWRREAGAQYVRH